MSNSIYFYNRTDKKAMSVNNMSDNIGIILGAE